MDNLRFEMTARGEETLRKLFEAIYSERQFKVVGYRTIPAREKLTGSLLKSTASPLKNLYASMTLYWSLSDSSPAIPLPTEMPLPEAASLVHAWLERSAYYGEAPQIDGSCSEGWRVSSEKIVASEGVNHGGHWSEILTVQPMWAHHHK